MTARCAVFGHRYRFRADGTTMTWTCERGCPVGGSKVYDSSEEAARYAAAFDREDSQDLGRRAPLLGMFPLRLVRAVRQFRRHE